MLKRVVDSRWFPLVDLLIVLGSGAIWYFKPEFGWKVLLIALLPWVIRLVTGKKPFRFTPFDIPILIFILTALLGAKEAYNQDTSWAKFWIILAAVLSFYALAGQPNENTWIIVGALTTIGVVITIVFLLTYDWGENPVKLNVVNRIGQAWMNIRPPVGLPAIQDEDSVSNLLLILIPFPIILLFHTWKRPANAWLLSASLFSISMFLLGLGMAATMQGVILSFIGILILLWWGVNTWLERKERRKHRKAFYLLTGMVLFLFFLTLVRFPDSLIQYVKTIPQLSRFEDRFEVIDNTLHLTRDFLFTGGGLGTFPGLYSLYILDIPDLFISYGKNLFLQLAVEQGLIGSIAFLSTILGGVFILLHQLYKKEIEARKNYFVYMCLLGYGALIVVGMFDAIIFIGLSIMFIFVMPGFTVQSLLPSQRVDTSYFYPTLVLVGGVLLFLASLGGKLPAALYANLGTLNMAQIDLAGWTYDQYITPQDPDQYGKPLAYFEKALLRNPKNHTANYRLGILAYRKGDYSLSGPYLEKALADDPGHRGIIKNLGYSYVWLGNLDQAEKLLNQIPEAGLELGYFSWWWGTQDRNDLSENANQMENILLSSQTKGNH